MSLAGQILSLAGIAASALFSRRRRRIELRLLAVRGEGPVRLAVRSAVESLPWLVLGGAAGWALAAILVQTYGPPSVVQASALRSAAIHAAVGVGLGIVLVAVAAGASDRAEGDEVAARTGELAARFR